MKMQGRSKEQFRVELLFLVQHSDSEPEEESDTLEDLMPLNIEDEESIAGSQDHKMMIKKTELMKNLTGPI